MEEKRRIKLLCPSVSASKIFELVAWEGQRLNLGSISRAFGVEPNSLKLNGHFISRGLDLIACSVTWRSLLSFFSARGFPTGATDSGPIIVHGKLAKLGSKRKHDLVDLGNEFLIAKQHGVSDANESPQLGHSDFVSNKRPKDCSAGNSGSFTLPNNGEIDLFGKLQISGLEEDSIANVVSAGLFNRIDQTTGSNFLRPKRKLEPLDADLSKRTRMNEPKSGMLSSSKLKH